MASLRRLAPLLLVLLLLAACSGAGGGTGSDTVDGEAAAPVGDAGADAADGAAAGDAAAGDADMFDVALVGPDGERATFAVELAVDQPQRQRGLMERTELAEGTGMLFLFPGDSEGGFWMKNTLIPLQIAYIAADGEVVDVLDMVPCTEDPCEIYTPRAAYRSALEVNAGALDAAGVEPGWTAELPYDLPDAS